jgi:hypothetical protein
MPEIELWTLLLGLIFGSIGFGYFIYGKKQGKVVIKYAGIALMVFPYFIENKYAVFGIGALLMAVPRFI